MERRGWKCSWCDPKQRTGAAVLAGPVNYGICAPCLERCLRDLNATRQRRERYGRKPGR